MNRRTILKTALFGVLTASFSPQILNGVAMAMVDKITKTSEQWKAILTPAQYHILREHGTEAPFTSPLNSEKRTGIYTCAGCDLPLFNSATKFESGTGWPSFYQAIEGSLGTTTDYLIGYARTEYHCARCGGHHGHIFNDGPQPTGLRHCNNGVALKFTPQ